VTKKTDDEKLRLLVARLNAQQEKQARQIDILCNDFIAAHRHFIKGLNAISFAADFYEAIAGVTDLNDLLHTASTLIREHIPEANVVFFLRREKNFELHIFEDEEPIGPEEKRIENCFTTELVDNITKSNKICTLDDMLQMGLQANPSFLSKISAYAVPLSTGGSPLGFILLYRSAENLLNAEQVKHISSISTGLSRSIAACRVLASSAT